MNDAYQKLSEMLDNWLSDSTKEIKMALIEKEILLEKMRRLYIQISSLETEERDVPQPETAPVAAPAEPEPKKEYTPAKTMEEDVELFFDTEHESYKAVDQELKNIAKEISATQETPEQPKPAPEKKKKTTPEPDIFDKIEKTEDKAEDKVNAPLEDDADKLFIEPDFEINVHSDTEANTREEDDILQFLPQKNAAEPTTEKNTEPITPKPAEQPVTTKPVVQPKEVKHEPVQPTVAKVEEHQPKEQKAAEQIPVVQKESLVQKPQQRSLNDLFNEQREDHSISSQYQRAKVGDLTKAISINDKFIYIKELFHNRGEDFSASIRQLNECHNMEEAFNCLDELKKKFFWDSKSDAYLSFCDLLRRKFS